MQTEISLRQKKTERASLWKLAFDAGLPAAMWRLPNQKQVNLVISENEIPILDSFENHNQSSGFAISTFQNFEKSYFIKADLMYCFDENDAPLSILGSAINLPKNDESILISKAKKATNIEQKKQFQDEYNSAIFEAMVNDAIAEIKSGKMQKVVLSRTKKVNLNEDFEIIKAFNELSELYPNAFISVVSMPHLDEIWMGASPEILVSQNRNGIFKTMALAGTQSNLDADKIEILPSEAAWKQKEIEEQAYVSRYIIDCFKKIRLREFIEEGPKTVRAGSLLHLKTDFSVDTQKVNMPELIETMLHLLHPTSAVCGMPKEPATDFILKTELHKRSFYSGYLGPVNINQESYLFVNLRTMKLQNQIATLYAGCGITENSNPAKEWLETEMKCQTMLKVLG